MPGLNDHPSTSLVKGLVLGDSGSGKTGGLLSLLQSGYKLRVFDFDNLLSSLTSRIREYAMDKADAFAYQTFTDDMAGPAMPLVMTGNAMKVMPFVKGQATAFPRFLRQLEHWKTPEEDLGDPGAWGPESIAVVDTLTTMSSAAYRFVQSVNPMGKEPQAYFFAAQQLVEQTLATLCSDSFKTNVLILAHIQYEGDGVNSLVKGWPRSVGSALNQKIGANFNCVLMVEKEGSGPSIKRYIRSNSTGIVDLKNPVAFKVPDRMPLETGLADFFAAITQKGK